MLQAFKNVGFDVEVITGYSDERRGKIADLKRKIEQGKRFAFAYSECLSIPTMFSDNNHLPPHPFLDAALFRLLQKYDVPLGLFYRDVYWRFDLYRDSVPVQKRLVSIPAYWYDWMVYQKYVRHLFLPSLEMAASLPGHFPHSQVSALPPGTVLRDVPPLPGADSGDKLHLLYVGDIRPPLYDLRQAVSTIQSNSSCELTICCPESAWKSVAHQYGELDRSRVHIVHARGAELEQLYRKADVFLMVRADHSYLSFAMPVKLFETLGYGVPVLTVTGTSASKFVEEQDIGWVIPTETHLSEMLHTLSHDREHLLKKRLRVRQVRERHTWNQRALAVANTLTGE